MSYQKGGLYNNAPIYEPYAGSYDDPGPYGYPAPYEEFGDYEAAGLAGLDNGNVSPAGFGDQSVFGSPYGVSPASQYGYPGDQGGYPGYQSYQQGYSGIPGGYPGYPGGPGGFPGGPGGYPGYPGYGPAGYGGGNRNGWIVLLIVLLVIGGYWLYRNRYFVR